MKKMAPLTKNLYREDEVLASLKYCVLKGRGQEAIFWAQEALDSEMRDDVLESLFWVWALAAAHANPWWLLSFREVLQKGTSATDEDILYLVMSLARNPQTHRDGTAVALLGLGLRQEIWCEERVGQPPVPPLSRALTPQELYITRALLQGKAAAAWGHLIPLWSADETAVWDLLKEIVGGAGAELLHLLQTAPLWFQRLAAPNWTWPRRAVAVALACWDLPAKPTAPWEPPIEWVASRFTWLANPMRFRRIYSPQPSALFWFTARGQLGTAQTTEAEIMGALEDSLRDGGSTFWASRCPELVASDESREAFYERYFPTDIPDEWSAAERQVSHGRGTISDPASVDWDLKFETMLNGWFGALPTRMWQGISGSLKAIFTATKFTGGRHAELLGTLAAAYTELNPAPLNEKVLVPVRREILVL
jgi:hypothetical protein